MPKVYVGRKYLPFFSSNSAELEMKVGDDDERRESPSFLCLPKPPSTVAMSSNAPIPPRYDFGALTSERCLTKTKSGGLPGGFH